jgi:hypothetical protein
VVVQTDRPPTRYIRVRELSDGTTALRLLHVLGMGQIACSFFFLLFFLGLLVSLLVPTLRDQIVFVADPLVGVAGSALFLIAIAVLHGLRFLRAERIVITPAGLVRRRGPFSRTDVAALDEISSVVLSGSNRVDVQLGRQRLQILGDRGYTEAELRWCAQRLRRAIDTARAVRSA